VNIFHKKHIAEHAAGFIFLTLIGLLLSNRDRIENMVTQKSDHLSAYTIQSKHS